MLLKLRGCVIICLIVAFNKYRSGLIDSLIQEKKTKRIRRCISASLNTGFIFNPCHDQNETDWIIATGFSLCTHTAQVLLFLCKSCHHNYVIIMYISFSFVMMGRTKLQQKSVEAAKLCARASACKMDMCHY